ncbi:phage replisome organizer N-terminal domain-containing protein [Clostridium sp. LS]|uniref:phage replisome organizer N-terminal domain-containing protein n=1 Tax=Clostridium sp. LS TaxID=1352601 RepID=UPI00325B0AF2
MNKKFFNKFIRYSIETLAIEFNRDIDKFKMALEVFIELEMIELNEDKIYSVKNFAKHQNIKIKERNNSKDKEEDINKIEVQGNETLKDEIVKLNIILHKIFTNILYYRIYKIKILKRLII